MRRTQGYTLIEIMISTAVLSVLLIAIMGFMATYVDAVSYHERTTDMLNTTTRAVDRLASVLGGAGVTSDDAGGQNILYQEPVGSVVADLDADGHLDVVWGSRRGASETVGGATVVRFVATDEYSEVEAATDLNGDGDTYDVFDVGHLEEVDYASTDTTQSPVRSIRITPDVILQVKGNDTGDVDGDGDPDPMFEFVGSRRLRIHLFASDGSDDMPAFANVSTVVELRNR